MQIMENKSKENAAIFLNGYYPLEHIDFYINELKTSRDSSMLIAVDGGLSMFDKCRIAPDLIIGDLDSINHDKINEYSKIRIVQIPLENKDKTDCECCLDWCIDNGVKNIILYGGLDSGSETDHLLGNLMTALTYRQSFDSIKIKEYSQVIIPVIDEQYSGTGEVGDFISVIPMSDEIRYEATGLKYNPGGAVYKFGSSASLRNELRDTNFIVNIEGKALIIKHFKA